MIGQLMKTIKNIINNKSLKQKIGITILMLALYRLLVMVPVPFVNIDLLMSQTQQA